MNQDAKNILWRQLGAAIDMLENAITSCPDRVWGDRIDWHEYWYLASHTLFWLDHDMSDADPDFAPPEPFDMCEIDPKGVLPPRIYTKEELLTYLDYGRQKCRKVIAALTEEDMTRPCVKRPHLTAVELMYYTMRHVQHHTAQLHYIQRIKIDSAPRWVGATKTPLED